MISTRHIRHDYKTWVDTDRKYLKAMCGVNTTSRLAGIPGITNQSLIVDKGGKVVWGWCLSCCEAVIDELDAMDRQLPTTEEIVYRYNVVALVASAITRRDIAGFSK